ncbi:Thioredoxin [hydrothermal vent metagenome]|uniref:Thioredoxin n=1 Tax=hydrothermal vent metagenome TaxID=652676 RepID=A0A1W1C6T7_9ZZZZ
MKLLITLLLLLLGLNALANEVMLKETEYKYVKSSIGKGKPYFLELGSDSCHSCQIMGGMLYKAKQKHPQYNIHFINVKNERKVAYELGIQMIPTQIIYDNKGKEVYRHMGVLSTKELDILFKENDF